MKTVFFYGLFMDVGLLQEKGFKPQNVRPACLNGYGLRIGKRATLERSEATCSYGVVMQLADSELTALYEADGVADYEPQTVKITDETGEITEVITYILPMEKVSGSNSQYAQRLAAVAKLLNFPTNYIKEIESWV